MSLISSFKGIVGETVINVAMWLKLDKDLYHRLNNITLPLDNGGSTQIDHIVVSKYGIFVIETKNYKGWIFGNEKQRQWTQSFPSGRKYQFQNPLRQNYLHIKTLADLLALDMSYFHSMIAFISECELKTRDELPEQVLMSGMASYIKRKQDEILTEDEVQSIVEQIENNRFNKSWRTNKVHKAYLKDRHSQTDKPIKTNSNPEFAIKSEPAIREIIKSREVRRWSGQTEIEPISIDEANILSINIQSANEQFSNDDKIFITPFAVVESGFKPTDKAYEAVFIKQIPDNLVQAPTCPKFDGEMVQRVAKKGARQGQIFYECSQFPKCRGVVNNN